ncbi:MAG: Dihydroxybiphenyl dioxygenase domain-containing protein [Candidatus Woesebacteria bacterium GW2011_GWB1_39_10b]|uniref:Dihydroxybiphenyl dioxygenase domain-containing protein n=1 Tax=Candidatus Woesebacteria bacterium GW2011_GWB1_39_10b TaxID=1618573 RepID=A0A0G0LPR4_9BACT|nr:MAG: Dihydroxybiphenyl dioxygenase domain-containing protein [Microgenomates group bacterium GW2011_GWC1_38_12]KKQ93878.1 MAG: Dihydroxybiphenyl dioxygenase domain-containing protein [Candidatus Woesebacteria bacterium GW2011_GWB1_39_10b]
MKSDDYSSFLDSWFSNIEKSGIDISGFPLDHLGYSVGSSEEYEETKKEFFKKKDKLASEIIFSGRRVAVIQLLKPLEYRDYHISAIELLEPKKGEKTFTGFEHAEFIISEPFEDVVKKYPKLPWDTNNINKPDFPRLKLVFDNEMELKFRHTPILKS